MSHKRLIALTTLMLCIILSSTLVLAQPTDIAGHWAQAELTTWVNQGLLGGYADNTVKPDANITRAEFFTFMNRGFKLAPTAVVSIKDVAESDWYYIDVLTAINAGYVGGYPDGTILPNNPITREEVANILSRYLKLAPTEGLAALKQLKDAPSDWSKEVVDSVVAKKLMGGYPDGTFGATKPITRAEAIATINRAMNLPKPEPVVANLYDKAGTFGPETGTQTITGDVTIAVADVVLRNITITGNLTLGEEIGDGNVTLKNVTVQGETIVNGGGAHSIFLENFNAGDVTVNKPGVRLVATGSTTVTSVTITNGAILAEVDLDGDGFGDVTVSEQLPAGATVELVGNFGAIAIASDAAVNLSGSAATVDINAAANVALNGDVGTVNVNAGATVAVSGSATTVAVNANATVNLAGNVATVNVNADSTIALGGAVTNLTVAATAAGADVAVNTGASVGTLVANAAVAVTGQGAITTATINTSGVTITQKPTTTTVAPGNTANVGGQVVTVPPTTTTPGPGPGPGPITPAAPKITGFTGFSIDPSTKHMTLLGGDGLTTATVTIDSPGANNTLTMKIGTTEIRTWNLASPTSSIAPVRDILGSAGRLLDFYVASGLTQDDMAIAIDYTGMISGITSQEDKNKVYDAVLPLVAGQIDPTEYAQIYAALNVNGIMTVANDATKTAIKSALQDAVDFYNATIVAPGEPITVGDMITDARTVFDNVQAMGIKTEFYAKIRVADILSALKAQPEVYSQINEVTLFSAVSTRVSNLSEFVLAVYGHMASFQESTKTAIYSNINFAQIISNIPAGRTITFIITDTANNQSSTYTVVVLEA